MAESEEFRDWTGLDAIRVLCSAIQKIHYFEKHQEGFSPGADTHGELILADALEYLAWGDTRNARSVMEVYDEWKQTGEAPWPWDGTKDPPVVPAGEETEARTHHQRAGTTFSEDGRTAFVTLRVDRRDYEFARHWALFHAQADPAGTAEDHLEGYLGTALTKAIDKAEWTAPPEIEALYPPAKPAAAPPPGDEDDGIPF